MAALSIAVTTTSSTTLSAITSAAVSAAAASAAEAAVSAAAASAAEATFFGCYPPFLSQPLDLRDALCRSLKFFIIFNFEHHTGICHIAVQFGG